MTLTSSRAKAVHKSSIPIKVEFVLDWVYILRGSLIFSLFLSFVLHFHSLISITFFSKLDLKFISFFRII